MSTFCIPTELAQRLKAAAKSGEIDIEEMYDMSTDERKDLFKKYVDEPTAKELNLGFEKAMISKRQTALRDWAKQAFNGGEEKQKQYKDVLTKIDELNKSGLLTPKAEKSLLQDFIAEKLGVTVTTDEAKHISDLSNKLQQEATKESDFGTPTIEYFKARRAMDDYLEGVTPSSNLKVVSSIISRGNMLFRLSSPLLNIESNTVNAALQAFARRIESKRAGGINTGYAIDYAKFANKVYAETGFDVTRMLSLDSERFVRGEDIVHSQGKGGVRALGRFYEDKIFEKTQGAPDVLFSSLAFSDKANIESTKLASELKLKGNATKDKALEIFKDATRIDPQTDEGKLVRSRAIADAFYSTYTNKSVAADVALGIRKVFNIASGDLRLGDQIMPFVKTPANVIQAGINLSGVGLPINASYRFFKVLKDIKEGTGFTEALKDEYAGFWKDVVQAGVGITTAIAISMLFEPDDFIGEFPVSEKERQLLALRNATTNSVKIGNKWVSLDYFGPLASGLVGLLYAKKYGKDLPSQVYNYTKGVLRQSAKIPGFDEAYNAVKALQEATPTAGKTVNDEVRDLANNLIGFVQSRATPGILYDLAKISDGNERVTNKNDVLGKLKSAIPGLRQTLPEKKTIFAEDVKTEPWYSILTAGSRVKTAKDDPVIQEFLRLDKTNNLPSITDVSKTSPRAKELRDQIGEERFSEAMDLFGTKFKEKTEVLIAKEAYKEATDERRKAAIDKIKNDLFDAVLTKYGYKKPKK